MYKILLVEDDTAWVIFSKNYLQTHHFILSWRKTGGRFTGV
jgi:hypothetical protein